MNVSPIDIVNAAVWIGAAGGVCSIGVQLFKMYVGDGTTPQQKVGAAVLVALVLTITYAASNSLISVANSYGLIVAWITIAATGAGLQSAITATVTNKPT